MAEAQRLQLFGGTGSPYTRKMVALLRYRRIPYSICWEDPAAALDARGLEKPRPIFHPTVLFTGPDGSVTRPAIPRRSSAAWKLSTPGVRCCHPIPRWRSSIT